MTFRPLYLVLLWISALGVVPAQGERTRGAKVTYERMLPAAEPRQVISHRARLLSLAVERGETPSPFLEPGYFRATWQAVVAVPERDRYRFRAEGRGTVELTLNGKVVLDGRMMPGRPVLSGKSVRLPAGDNDLRLVLSSPAMGDGELRLFWQPPDGGYEPIPPVSLSWAGDDADITAGELSRRGQQLFAERRCARCHEFEQQRVGESAFAELDAAGPDLRAVGGRLQRDWLAAWLLEPRSFRHDATMPKLGLSPAEVGHVAVWLSSSGEPLAVELPATVRERGESLFLELGCIACHVSPERPPQEATLGDRLPLHHVPQKWHVAALVDYLQDPGRFYPHVRMPDYRLGRDDATALAAYLHQGGTALPAVSGDVKRGRRIAQEKRCLACHQVDVPRADEHFARKLRNLEPQRGCLADAPKNRGDAPDHELTADDRQALRAFLPFAESVPFRRAPLDFAQRHLLAQRCVNCHAVDDAPSVWTQVADQWAQHDVLPPEQDPAVQGVPSLTWVGAKLQPSWISTFVTGRGVSPRPWLHARMPAYPVRGAAISQGLVREHGYGQQDEPAVAVDPQLASHGRGLVQMGAGFGCVQCHALGSMEPQQVFARQGIELFTAQKRLRHEYYSRWLLDPPRIDAESGMPKFADERGKTAFKNVLGGDAQQQFEAIWHYLGERR